MTITDDIEKSNFNPQMLKSCTDTSYQCGYEKGRAEAIDEIIEYYKPCNDCCACLEDDRDYFKKKCEMDIQISYIELVEELKQLKEQK